MEPHKLSRNKTPRTKSKKVGNKIEDSDHLFCFCSDVILVLALRPVPRRRLIGYRSLFSELDRFRINTEKVLLSTLETSGKVVILGTNVGSWYITNIKT